MPGGNPSLATGPQAGVIDRVLHRVFSSLAAAGDLQVTTASGRAWRFGDGAGARLAVRFTDRRAECAFLLDPDLRVGELFTDGRLIVECGSIYGFLALLLQKRDAAEPFRGAAIIETVRERLARWSRNTPRRSRRNAAHHYDLDERLYALFLDPDWQYSCAYFEHPGQSLAEAQLAKKRHVAAKLLMHPGVRVLDIGAGWGGLACYLADVAGAGHVLGIGLSERQVGAAQARAQRMGLSGRVAFRLQDFRGVEGTFDRIVSVGMFEHVGRRDYPTFFKTCRARLAEDGVMLLHTIGSSEPPSLTNPWITRYIFPGGHLPSLSDLVAAAENAGLTITDIEVLRLHYADTLQAWRTNFMARRQEAAGLYGEAFCRMWEYYLSMAEAAFRHDDAVVFQVQLAKSADAVPRTRAYIRERTEELRARERSAPTLRSCGRYFGTIYPRPRTVMMAVEPTFRRRL
jgi:cyclopropane-fatty-acyl-phospholipid synthase